MFLLPRRCLMRHGRRLMTTATHHPPPYLMNRRLLTPTTTSSNNYRCQVTPTYNNQLLVFRSLSTEATPNDGKGPVESFPDWLNSITQGKPMEVITKYLQKMYVTRLRTPTPDTHLKYQFTGLKGVLPDSVTAEIRNSQDLLVSGSTKKSDGTNVRIERSVTLPINDYSQAKKKATFYRDSGSLVVDISDFTQIGDINIKVEGQTKP